MRFSQYEDFVILNVNTPLLSIVIPVKRTFHLIETLLRDFDKRYNDQIEILIVYDLGEQLPETLSTIKSVKYIQVESVGLGAARNKGLSETCGEYILFCDVDDEIDFFQLMQTVFTMRENKADLCLSPYYIKRENSTKLVLHSLAHNNIPIVTNDLDKLILDRYFCFCWNKICHRKLLENRTIIFPAGEYEDIYWSISVIAQAKVIYMSDVVFYTYRIHTESAVNQASLRHIIILDQYLKVLTELVKQGKHLNFLNAVRRRAITHVLFVLCKSNRLNSLARKNLFNRLLIELNQWFLGSLKLTPFNLRIDYFTIIKLRCFNLVKVRRFIWYYFKI